jgi:predicted metal-dependent phosphotriesterase family hydrolase
MRVIRTVLGDIEPAAAGVVDSHDHLFLTTPVLPGEELDDEVAAAAVLRAFAAAGGGTVVQWTPRGLQRGLPALRRISESTGVHVVAATGRHRRAIYGPSAEPDLTVDDLARAFIGDITERGCGLIKVGISYQAITPDETDALRAAAIAHHATGAPIAIHLEQGSAAELVLDALVADEVPPRSIVLGHLGRNPELTRITAAAQSGAWLCLDTPSPRHPLEFDRLAEIFATLVDHGHLAQLLLGADTTLASSRANPLSFGPAALLRNVVPRLTHVLGADSVSRIIVDNPARAWASDQWPPSATAPLPESGGAENAGI